MPNCTLDWSNITDKSILNVNLGRGHESIETGVRERFFIYNLSVEGAGVIYINMGSVVYIDGLNFSSEGILSFYDVAQYGLTAVALGEDLLKDDSILNRLKYVSNGKSYILERDRIVLSRYWLLKPNFSVNWTPPSTPEPSTYGAIISACVLGLGVWRRRKSRVKLA